MTLLSGFSFSPTPLITYAFSEKPRAGIEPATSRLPSARSNQLSYRGTLYFDLRCFIPDGTA